MHLEATNFGECDFLTTALETYLGVWLELGKDLTDDLETLNKVQSETQEIGAILGQIIQYHEAYPSTKDESFYLELKQHEVEHLLQSFHILSRVRNDELSEEYGNFIYKYTSIVNDYLKDFGRDVYDEIFVKTLFDKYKKELKKYCEDTISEHIKNGNKEVYIFCIHSFPGNHNQLSTLNTVESLHSMSDGDGFKEAANYGCKSELYNPACFDIEGEVSEEYVAVEYKIQGLFNKFYTLSNEYSKVSFKEGSEEYNQIKKMNELANRLFKQNSVDVLKELDCSGLNQAKIFCAVLYTYESSEEEFYENAKQTIPKEKFNLIFPNAGRIEEDYIDFDKSSRKDAAVYMINYIKDFNMGTVPNDRYYTDDKAFEYGEKLEDYQLLIDNPILLILEYIVQNSKPNPNNPEEKHFIGMFTKEGRVLSELSRVLSKTEEFVDTTQERLIKLFKKVIIGMVPSTKYITFAHIDLVSAIIKTDKEKYPEIECHNETGYLKNINDYIK